MPAKMQPTTPVAEACSDSAPLPPARPGMLSEREPEPEAEAELALGAADVSSELPLPPPVANAMELVRLAVERLEDETTIEASSDVDVVEAPTDDAVGVAAGTVAEALPPLICQTVGVRAGVGAGEIRTTHGKRAGVDVVDRTQLGERVKEALTLCLERRAQADETVDAVLKGADHTRRAARRTRVACLQANQSASSRIEVYTYLESGQRRRTCALARGGEGTRVERRLAREEVPDK